MQTTQHLNRAEPNLPAHTYQTFAIKAPVSTHFRAASCAEMDCPNYLGGWRVHVEALTPDLVHAARNSGRKYVEQHVAEGHTYLVFEAGQPCFRASQHRTRIDRPELYVVRNGDHRQSFGETRQHSTPEHWVEEFAENQDRLIGAKQRG